MARLPTPATSQCRPARDVESHQGPPPQGRQAPQPGRPGVARRGLSRAQGSQPAALLAQGEAPARSPRRSRIDDADRLRRSRCCRRASRCWRSAAAAICCRAPRRLRRPTCRRAATGSIPSMRACCSSSTIWASRSWSAASTGSMRPSISTPRSPTAARLTVLVEVASIDLDLPAFEEELRGPEWFDAGRFPAGALREPGHRDHRREHGPGRGRADPARRDARRSRSRSPSTAPATAS